MVEETQNQPKISMKLIKLEEKEDRISALPDCLIIEIMSRLPSTKDAIRTGRLSKRLIHLWTSVHNLIFLHNLKDPPSLAFILFVMTTLSQRGQMKVKKFELCSNYYNWFESELKDCIPYAISCKAEELVITLRSSRESQYTLHFRLDQCI